MIDLFDLFIDIIKFLINFDLFIYCFCLLFISSLFSFVRWRLM